ncbi:hypothetical protein TIFTF001_008348 [Ficus carica]|uniref:C2H2-type domain-containing protein n=1 Tax=Ficus carica TaxID=3494 RepID=A0AA87ZL76_FICCA|nr:hypothetical protein TIFTF001_008348 [Ficus carica]
MATNRFICEICNKGFQRDQNLQLHRRGHNLPWKLRQRTNKDPVKKKVYICPEKTCVHHDASRALGDLTGIKKHFSRKHGEKKWKCEKCSKKYAVQSDWKAHSKTCGTREYKCDCGTLFSRKDSFITHRAFCDALAEESARLTSSVATNLSFGNETMNTNTNTNNMVNHPHQPDLHSGFAGRTPGPDVPGMAQYGPTGFQDFNNIGDQHHKPRLSLWLNQQANSHQLLNPMNNNNNNGAANNFYVPSSSNLPHHDQMAVQMGISSSSSTSTLFGNSGHFLGFEKSASTSSTMPNLSLSPLQVGISLKEEAATKPKPAVPMSATALLQKAAQMGSTRSSNNNHNHHNNNNSSSGPTTMSSFASLNNQNRSILDCPNALNQVIMQKSSPVSTTTASGKVSSSTDQQPVSVLRLQYGSSNGIENGLTRDFLGSGSGDQNSQRQFLPVQELGKTVDIIGVIRKERDDDHDDEDEEDDDQKSWCV